MSEAINQASLRQKMENGLVTVRDAMEDGKPVVNDATGNELPTTLSHHEAIQTYLLLRILEKLEQEK